jgi:hypothetical protein
VTDARVRCDEKSGCPGPHSFDPLQSKSGTYSNDRNLEWSNDTS